MLFATIQRVFKCTLEIIALEELVLFAFDQLEHFVLRHRGVKAMAQDPCQLFVGNLPDAADEEALQAYFIKFGKVEECRLMRYQNTGETRGFGFVTF